MSKELFLSRAGFLTESSFAAGGSGHADLPGKMTLQIDPTDDGEVAKVSFWRTPQDSTPIFKNYTGKLELEFSVVSPVVKGLLACALETVSTATNTPSAGLTTTILRVPLIQSRNSFSLVAEYDGGPYYRYDGCIVNRVRFAVQRRGALPSIGFDFVSAKRTPLGGPSSLSASTHVPLTHMNAVVEVGGTPLRGIGEFSFGISNDASLTAWGEDGRATDFQEGIGANFSGEIVQRHIDAVIWPLVESRAESTVLLAMDVAGVRRFELDCGRVQFVRGTPPFLGEGDSITRAGWDALAKTEVDATEPKLTIVTGA